MTDWNCVKINLKIMLPKFGSVISFYYICIVNQLNIKQWISQN